MSKMTRLGLISILTASVVHADDTLPIANNFDEVFANGNVSGQIELMYSGHKIKNNKDPYSTAIGGQLKYETAAMDGFGAGVEFTTVHEVDGLSGDTVDKRATLMVSQDGSYTQLSQSYINYGYKDLNLRIGRQLIDTPLANSDDYRIVNNTFEAAVATYEISDVSMMLGYLHRWQGTDAFLNNEQPWQDTGKDGTYFGSVAYTSDLLNTSAWYYDISESSADNIATGNVANTSTYLDATFRLNLSDDFTLDTSVQYLDQKERANSGTNAVICGLMLESSIYKNLGLRLAYNHRSADDDKTSFWGFGGGTLYTSMDNMILDAIVGGDADALIAGISYQISDLGLYYTYGIYERDATSSLAKEEIAEQNMGADYSVDKNLILSAILTIDDDKEDTGSNAIYPPGGDFTNIRLAVSYTF